MAIRDRSLFSPELDFMMPDAAPPGVSVGPTGAGDPILDLLTPATPNLGGGITTGGVPSFQTDVMNYNPETWKNFLRQLIKENPGRFQEIYLGKSNLPVHMQGPLEEVANESRSVAGQAVAKIPSIPGIQVPGSLVGDFISSPIDTTVGVGRAAKRRGGEVLDDIGAMLERIKAGTTLPAEKGREVIAGIKAREAAEVTPTMELEKTLTDIARGEVEGLPEEEKGDIKKRMKENIVEGAEGVVLGSEAAGEKIKEIMKPWFKGRGGEGGWQPFSRLSRLGGFEGQVGGAGAEEGVSYLDEIYPDRKNEKEIQEDQEIVKIESTDGNVNEETVVTKIIEEVPSLTKNPDQESSVKLNETNVDGAIEQFVETTLNPAVRNTTTNPTLKMMQETPEIIQMAAIINRYVNGGRVPDARDAFFDLLDGIAAGLASEINPGVGIAKGAALGNAKFQERVAKEKENKIKSIEEANDYLSTLAAYDAAVAKAKAGGIPSPTENAAMQKLADQWLEKADEIIVGNNSVATVDSIINAIDTGQLPVGLPGFGEEMQARIHAFLGGKELKSKRLELKDKLQKITQQSLQAILNESGRTISDRDRQLIAKLIGDLESTNWQGLSTPVGNLRLKLVSFRDNFITYRNASQVSFSQLDARNRLYPFLVETNATARRRQEVQNLGSIPVYQDVGGVITIVSRVPE